MIVLFLDFGTNNKVQSENYSNVVMNQTLYFVQYLILLPFIVCIKSFKIKNRLKIAHFLGKYFVYFVCRYILKKRYQIFIKNLHIIHGESITQSQYRQYLLDYCINMMTLIVESFITNKSDQALMAQNVISDQTRINEVLELLRKKEKIIIMSIHIGNWEVAHHYCTNILNMQVAIIYRKQNNQYCEKIIEQSRHNVIKIDKKDKHSLKNILHCINSGKTIVVLIDQRDAVNGEKIEICNTEAMMPTAMIKFAKKQKCYILPAYTVRIEGKIHLILHDILPPSTIMNKSTQEVAQVLFDDFSHVIKKYTTQWCCMMYNLWRK